jgi:hypothetical protein
MTMTADPDYVPAYGFRRPDRNEARSSLERIYGDEADRLWAEIVRGLGLDVRTAPNTDEEFTRIVDAFLDNEDPVVGLCGQALKIRQETFRHLSSASDHIKGAQ